MYERITGVSLDSLVSVHRGQASEADPVTIPVDVEICDYGTDVNCALYMNRDYFTRITMTQTSSISAFNMSTRVHKLTHFPIDP